MGPAGEELAECEGKFGVASRSRLLAGGCLSDLAERVVELHRGPWRGESDFVDGDGVNSMFVVFIRSRGPARVNASLLEASQSHGHGVERAG